MDSQESYKSNFQKKIFLRLKKCIFCKKIWQPEYRIFDIQLCSSQSEDEFAIRTIFLWSSVYEFWIVSMCHI